MKIWKYFAIFLLGACLDATAQSNFSPDHHAARDKGVHFVLNLHTGLEMKAEEWLTQRVINSFGLKEFGGLKRMTSQTASFTHRYGGIRELKVRKTELIDNSIHMEIEVFYVDDELRQSSPSMAARGEIVWTFRLIKIDGKWLIDMPPYDRH